MMVEIRTINRKKIVKLNIFKYHINHIEFDIFCIIFLKRVKYLLPLYTMTIYIYVYVCYIAYILHVVIDLPI